MSFSNLSCAGTWGKILGLIRFKMKRSGSTSVIRNGSFMGPLP